jgi:hypothetical protein
MMGKPTAPQRAGLIQINALPRLAVELRIIDLREKLTHAHIG